MPIDEATLRGCKRIDDELLELQFEGQFLALVLALRAFTVSQPRVPAGNPDGGRWVAEGGDIVLVAQNEPPRQYAVDLAEEERRGGHAILRHVGRSDEDMLNEVRQDRVRGLVESYSRKVEGTFLSVETANDLVNRTLEADSATVDLVAAGRLTLGELDKRFGYPTGREAFRPEPDAEPYIRKTYNVRVVIVPDPARPRGYRVLTAFPKNEASPE